MKHIRTINEEFENITEGKIARYQIGNKEVTRAEVLDHMYHIKKEPGMKWKQGKSPKTQKDITKLIKQYGEGNVAIHGLTNGGDPVADVFVKESVDYVKESPQWGGPEYKKLNGAFSRFKVNIDIQHYDNSGGFMSTYDNISQDELQVIANKVGRKLGMEFKVGEPIKSQESGYYIDINFKTLH